MGVSIFCVTLDCRDPVQLARFWEAALAYEVDLDHAGYGEVVLTDPVGTGPMLLFMTVPEPKTVKNRMHLDLMPEAGMEAEVARLVGLGANELRTQQDPEGYPEPWIWTVLLDPEGNEFCVGEPLAARRG